MEAKHDVPCARCKLCEIKEIDPLRLQNMPKVGPKHAKSKNMAKMTNTSWILKTVQNSGFHERPRCMNLNCIIDVETSFTKLLTFKMGEQGV